MFVYDAATLGLNIDSKQFNKELNAAGTNTERVLQQMKLNADAFDTKWKDLTAGIKDTKRIISGILISRGFYALLEGLTSVSGAVLTFSENMEAAKVSLEYFTDAAAESVEASNKVQAYLNQVNAFAAKTPFTTEYVLSVSRYMQAVGISMNVTQSFLQVITDAAAATGATQENLQRIVYALGQMKSKGRIAAEEIRQLANAGIPATDILKEELGLTGNQIQHIGEYWVDADKGIVAILNGLQKRYAGAADRIADTMKGMTDTIVDDSKIIASEAFGGVYNQLSSFMSTIRDKLDEYREIVTEQGAAGLLNEVLWDLDPSGEVGTAILNFIGNIMHLGDALHSLYLNAQPIIQIFGTAFAGSLNVAVIGLTGLTQVLDGVVQFLNKLGLTSGTTAQVISSLIIAYKASQWLGLMGQAAVKAAYGLYETGAAAVSMVTSATGASTGIAILTTSLGGLVAAALTVISVFQMMNGVFSGLNGSLGQSDYATQFADYQKKMEAYYAQVQAYQDEYTKSYTTIDDNAKATTGDIEDTTKATKAGAAAAQKWVAAFDEVYSIPDASGSSSKAPTPPDFGMALKTPEIKFPTIDIEKLTKPVLDLADAFKNGFMDSDVLNSNWWAAFLPAVIVGGMVKLGDILSKNSKLTAKEIKDVAKNIVMQTTQERLLALKQITRNLDMIDKDIKETLNRLADTKTLAADRDVLIGKLEMLVDEGEKLLKTGTDIQQMLDVPASKLLTKASLIEADQAILINKLENIATEVYEGNKLLASIDAGSAEATAIRNEIKELTKKANEFYAVYSSSYGSNEIIEEILTSANIQLTSINSDINKLNQYISKITDSLGRDSTAILNVATEIKEGSKLANKILKELVEAGLDTSLVAQMNKLLSIAQDVLVSINDFSEKIELRNKLREIISSAEARSATGERVPTVAIREELSKLDESLAALDKKLDVLNIYARAVATNNFEFFNKAQAILDNNSKFLVSLKNTVGGYLSDIFGTLKKIGHYGPDLLITSSQGTATLKRGIDAIERAINKMDKSTQEALHELYMSIHHDMYVMYKYGEKPSGSFDKYLLELKTAIIEYGKKANVSEEVITKAIYAVELTVKELKDVSSDLDYVLKAKALATAPVVNEPTKTPSKIWDILRDKLAIIEKSVTSVEEYQKLANKELVSLRTTMSKEFANNSYLLETIVKEQIAEFKENKIKAQKLAELVERNPKVFKQTLHEELDAFGKKLELINTTDTNKILNGIISATIDPADFASEIVKKAGIFNPKRLAMSGGDAAAIVKGIDDYGETIKSALVKNLFENIKEMYGIHDAVKTIAQQAAMIAGKVLEAPTKSVINQMLENLGKKLYQGLTVFSEEGSMQAQLDALVASIKTGNIETAMDVKVFTQSVSDKMTKLLDQVGTISDSGIYTIPAKAFKQFLTEFEHIAYQLGVQAAILGKTEIYLGALNKGGLGGIGKVDVSQFAGYDLTDPAQMKIVEKKLQNIFETQLQVAGVAEAIKNNTRLIKISIPKSFINAIKTEIAPMFIQLQNIISEQAMLGKDIKLLIEPMNKLGLTMGDFMGQRYVSGIFNPNMLPGGRGVAAINDQLRTIVQMLKSGRESLFGAGMNKIDSLLDYLIQLTYGMGDTSIIHPRIGTGIASVTRADLERAIEELKRLKEVYQGYASATSVSLSDIVKQINRSIEAGKQLSDVVTSRGKTLKDLIHTAIYQAKVLENIYGQGGQLVSALQSMLHGNTALSAVNNPYDFANIKEIIETLMDDIRRASLEASQALLEASEIIHIASVEEAKALEEALKAEAEAALARKLADETAAKEAAKESTAIFRIEAAADEMAKSAEKIPVAITEVVDTQETVASINKVAADELTDAAADLKSVAANELADAAADLKTAASISRDLTSEESVNLLKAIDIDINKSYKIIKDEGDRIVSTIHKGSTVRRLVDSAIESGYAGFEIYDELGNLLYSPKVIAGTKALTEFLNTLFATSTEINGVAKELAATPEFLEKAAATLDKISPEFSKVFSEAVETLGEASTAYGSRLATLGEELGDNLYEAVGSGLKDNVAKKLATLFDGLDIGSAIDATTLKNMVIKQVQDAIGDKVFKAFGDTIEQVTANTIDKAFTEAASNLSDDVLKKAAANISDEVAEAFNKVMAEATEETAAKLGSVSIGRAIAPAISLIFNTLQVVADLQVNQQFADSFDSQVSVLAANNETLKAGLDKLKAAGVSTYDLANFRDNTNAIVDALLGVVDLLTIFSGIGTLPALLIGGASALTSIGLSADKGSVSYYQYQDLMLNKDAFIKKMLDIQDITLAEAEALYIATQKTAEANLFTANLDKGSNAYNIIYGLINQMGAVGNGSQASVRDNPDTPKTDEQANSLVVRLLQALGKLPTVDVVPGSGNVAALPADIYAEYGALWQTNSVQMLTDLLDYIYKGGNGSSEAMTKLQTAIKTLPKEFQDEVNTAIKQVYGDYADAYGYRQQFIDMLNKQTGGHLTLDQIDTSTLMEAMVQYLRTIQQSELNAYQVQGANNTLNGNVALGDVTRIIQDADFGSFSSDIIKGFADQLGIVLSSINKSFTDASGNLINQVFGKITIDSDKFMGNVIGWTEKLPDNINLSVDNLTTDDIAILAQAGIQINSDGTITFMKAQNENTTGTERVIDLQLTAVAPAVLQSLKEAGLTIDFGGGGTELNLSIDTLSKNMTSALFKLAEDLSGSVSDKMRETLAGLGEITESGYFKITNPDVLQGKQTIAGYLASLGDKLEDVSPEVKYALMKIQEVMNIDGQATAKSIATWANGIAIESPFSADELTDEMRESFQKIGVTFTEEDDKLIMIINQAGQQLKDGVTLIPNETWDNLNTDVITALQNLGVTMTKTSGGVMVDVSGTMQKGINNIVALYTQQPEIWGLLPESVRTVLEQCGIASNNGMLQLNADQLYALMTMKGQWFDTWSSVYEKLGPELQTALSQAGVDTSTGMATIKKYVDESSIPDGVKDFVIVPFESIPGAVRDNMGEVANELTGQKVVIYNATATAFSDMTRAVTEQGGAAVTEAQSIAIQIGEAVTNALNQAAQFSKLKPGGGGGLFGASAGILGGTTYTLGTGIYKKSTGYTYYPRYDGKGQLVDYTWMDDKGKQQYGALPAYAYGGLITTDGLYRAGEFGDTEAIIPLENKQSLQEIGGTIAQYVSTDANKTVLAISGAVDAITSLLDKEHIETITILNKTATEDTLNSILQIIATEESVSNLSDLLQSILSTIEISASNIASSISMLSLGLTSAGSFTGSSDLSSSVPTTSEKGGFVKDGVFYEYNAIATIPGVGDVPIVVVDGNTLTSSLPIGTIVHGTSGDYVITGGESISVGGTGYTSTKIPGSAMGSIVTSDGLYRLGEDDLKEAVIPLERPDIMAQLGQSIVSAMPMSMKAALYSAQGMSNAGISYGRYTVNNSTTSSDNIAQAVLERVLPQMMMFSGGSDKTPIYVNTLVADERGLELLERKLYEIRKVEETRRG